jgi:hypothetical protein
LVFSDETAESKGNEPATRADLRALDQRLVQALIRNQAEILEKTQEFVRDSQTELLRGFDAWRGCCIAPGNLQDNVF